MRIIFQIVFLLLASTAISVAADSPRATFDRETHDYGKVMYGDTVAKEFVLKNTGNKTLKIEKLESTCGCTKAVQGSTEIEPGGETKITASFNTDGLRAGKKQKSVFVHTNDPDKPVTKLLLTADVIRDLNIEPQQISSKLPEFKSNVELPVKITNESDKPIEITKIETLDGGYAVKMSPEKVVLKPHSTSPVTFAVTLRSSPGKEYFIGKLTLHTDHPREKEIEVRYLIKLDKPA